MKKIGIYRIERFKVKNHSLILIVITDHNHLTLIISAEDHETDENKETNHNTDVADLIVK